jgi:hypothetical protein
LDDNVRLSIGGHSLTLLTFKFYTVNIINRLPYAILTELKSNDGIPQQQLYENVSSKYKTIPKMECFQEVTRLRNDEIITLVSDDTSNDAKVFLNKAKAYFYNDIEQLDFDGIVAAVYDWFYSDPGNCEYYLDQPCKKMHLYLTKEESENLHQTLFANSLFMEKGSVYNVIRMRPFAKTEILSSGGSYSKYLAKQKEKEDKLIANYELNNNVTELTKKYLEVLLKNNELNKELSEAKTQIFNLQNSIVNMQDINNANQSIGDNNEQSVKKKIESVEPKEKKTWYKSAFSYMLSEGFKYAIGLIFGYAIGILSHTNKKESYIQTPNQSTHQIVKGEDTLQK